MQQRLNIERQMESERKKKTERIRKSEEDFTFQPDVLPIPHSLEVIVSSARKGTDVYEHLYNHVAESKLVYSNLGRKNDKANKEFSPFEPEIDSNSVVLSNHARQRRHDLEDMFVEEAICGGFTPLRAQLSRRLSIIKSVNNFFPTDKGFALHELETTEDKDKDKEQSKDTDEEKVQVQEQVQEQEHSSAVSSKTPFVSARGLAGLFPSEESEMSESDRGTMCSIILIVQGTPYIFYARAIKDAKGGRSKNQRTDSGAAAEICTEIHKQSCK